jgi:hypothetical protein
MRGLKSCDYTELKAGIISLANFDVIIPDTSIFNQHFYIRCLKFSFFIFFFGGTGV